jgi:predicted metal-dependent TIM-barrel fold hydrolase
MQSEVKNMDVFDSMLLGLLRFSGVQGIDALEAFCNQYNYSPNVVLTEAIRAYLKAVAEYEKQKAEEQVYGIKPKVTVGVNV